MFRNLLPAFPSLVVILAVAAGFSRFVKQDERFFRDPYAVSDGQLRRLRYDTAIGWTGRPGAKAMHLEERLNRRGPRGPDFPDEKPPGVVRIVALGDSCTFGI